jgi:hypothetical protein
MGVLKGQIEIKLEQMSELKRENKVRSNAVNADVLTEVQNAISEMDLIRKTWRGKWQGRSKTRSGNRSQDQHRSRVYPGPLSRSHRGRHKVRHESTQWKESRSLGQCS